MNRHRRRNMHMHIQRKQTDIVYLYVYNCSGCNLDLYLEQPRFKVVAAGLQDAAVAKTGDLETCKAGQAMRGAVKTRLPFLECYMYPCMQLCMHMGKSAYMFPFHAHRVHEMWPLLRAALFMGGLGDVPASRLVWLHLLGRHGLLPGTGSGALGKCSLDSRHVTLSDAWDCATWRTGPHCSDTRKRRGLKRMTGQRAMEKVEAPERRGPRDPSFSCAPATLGKCRRLKERRSDGTHLCVCGLPRSTRCWALACPCWRRPGCMAGA